MKRWLSEGARKRLEVLEVFAGVKPELIRDRERAARDGYGKWPSGCVREEGGRLLACLDSEAGMYAGAPLDFEKMWSPLAQAWRIAQQGKAGVVWLYKPDGNGVNFTVRKDWRGDVCIAWDSGFLHGDLPWLQTAGYVVTEKPGGWMSQGDDQPVTQEAVR